MTFYMINLNVGAIQIRKKKVTIIVLPSKDVFHSKTLATVFFNLKDIVKVYALHFPITTRNIR